MENSHTVDPQFSALFVSGDIQSVHIRFLAHSDKKAETIRFQTGDLMIQVDVIDDDSPVALQLVFAHGLHKQAEMVQHDTKVHLTPEQVWASLYALCRNLVYLHRRQQQLIGDDLLSEALDYIARVPDDRMEKACA